MRGRRCWSYTALSQYLRCPLQYYFQRVARLPVETVTSGLALGSAVHSALAEYHWRLKDDRRFRTEEILTTFRRAWDERTSRERLLYRNGENPDQIIDRGVGLIETYLREPPPEAIVAVEQEFVVPVYDGEGEYQETPLVAIADLITNPQGMLPVTEFKTSGRAYSSAEIETSLQATSYAHAIHESFGVEPLVGYAVLVKTKTPKVQRLVTTRTREDFGRLGDLIAAVERAVNFGLFYPVETPLNCSGCPFRQPCREWKPADRPGVEPLPPDVSTACSPR